MLVEGSPDTFIAHTFTMLEYIEIRNQFFEPSELQHRENIAKRGLLC